MTARRGEITSIGAGIAQSQPGPQTLAALRMQTLSAHSHHLSLHLPVTAFSNGDVDVFAALPSQERAVLGALKCSVAALWISHRPPRRAFLLRRMNVVVEACIV